MMKELADHPTAIPTIVNGPVSVSGLRKSGYHNRSGHKHEKNNRLFD